MSKSELIDSHVSEHQCKLAVEALHTHESKKEKTRQENELLPGKEQNVWLIVTVKKIHPNHKFKPIKIPIVHSLVDPRTMPVCLITKDPQRQYKDLLESHGIKFISRVVGIAKLKGKFKPFEARRMLLKENGMFLADERVIPLLPKLLGVKWFEAKKQPIPICLTRKDLKSELERAISSTYMHQNNGTCTSIKISTLSQKPSKILANIKSGLPVIVKNIKGGWDNIQTIHIKTNSSVSLPVWSCNLDESKGGRWDGLGILPDEEVEDSEEESDDSEVDIDNVKDAKKKQVMGDIDGISKSKKRKASLVTGSEPTLTASSSSAAPISAKKSSAASDPADSIDSPPSKKAKHGKGKAAATAAIIDPAPPVQETPEAEAISAVNSSSKRKKKSQASKAIEPPACPSPQVIPVVDKTTGAPPQKKKKSHAPAEPAPEAKGPTVTDDAPSKPKRKDRKGKKADEGLKSTTDAGSTGVSLSKAELKLKRSGGIGEKKKDKVVKAKGGKSAKDGIIGKKVAQG